MKLGTKPTIREGNILYMILGILLLSLGGYVQSRNYYSGILITQYVIILLPPLIYLKSKNYSIKENLRLNKTTFKNIILTIFIVIFSYPIAVFFNLIGILFITKFGTLIDSPIQMPNNIGSLLTSFLLIAVSPGICEEIMFRGFLLSSYEKLGKRKAIIYSAILFGVFHFNLQNLLGPIVLGIVFGIIVMKTDSILVSMVGHTTNNAIALVLGYVMNRVNIGEVGNDVAIAGDAIVENPNLLFSIFILAIIPLLCLIIVSNLIKQLDSGENRDKHKLIEINDGNMLLIKEIERINFMTILPIIITLIIYAFYNYRIFFV